MKDRGGPAFPGDYLDPEIVDILKSARASGLPISLQDIKHMSKGRGMSWLDYAAIHSPNFVRDSPQEEAAARFDWAEAMLAEKRRREK